MCNMQVFEALKQGEWKLTPELIELVLRRPQTITQTKLVEDGMRQGRVQQQNPNFKKEIADDKAWE
eukprot:9399156-Pyramimonas_sp.AAC.1